MRWHLLWLALPFCFWGCAKVDIKGCGGLPDGTPCDDGNPCTESDACTADFCQGFLKDCTFLDDACQSGACDSNSGECVVQPFEDNTPCTSGNFCVEGETCQGGVCGGGQDRVCVAADPCQEGFCDFGSGACLEEPGPDGVPCDDGDACTGPGDTDDCVDGGCTPGAPVTCSLPPGIDSECALSDCDPADTDGDPCIVVFDNEGDPCDDNDPDTINTTCTQGFCGNGAPACAPDDSEPNENTNAAEPLVFGAFSGSNICPADLDFYSFELVLPGSSVAMEVRDATGGCAFDSVLELRREDGSALGQFITSDDDSGAGGDCSAIAPAQDANATDLAAGTYFAVVKGKTGDEQGAYVVEVEASTDLETEPNDVIGDADRHQLSSGPFQGRLDSASDVDIVRFQVSAKARLFAFLTDGDADDPGCPFDGKLELLNSLGQVVSGAVASDGGSGGCPLLDLTFAPPAGFTDLNPGEFFLKISGENGGFGFYQLDAVFEAVEHESNNNIASAEGLFDSGTIFAELTSSDSDFFKFTLTAPGSIGALTSQPNGDACPNPLDTVLELRDAAGVLLASNDDTGSQGLCSFLNLDTAPNSGNPVNAGGKDLPPGDYFLVVRGFDSNSLGSYRLLFAVVHEEESEPNGTTASADTITPTQNRGSATGRLSPFSIDMYKITVPEGADLTIETSDGAGSCVTDTLVDLRDTNGLSTSTLETDDDGGLDIPGRGFGCSKIDPASDDEASDLPAGTYFIVVRPFTSGSTSAQGPYVLSVTITP